MTHCMRNAAEDVKPHRLTKYLDGGMLSLCGGTIDACGMAASQEPWEMSSRT